MLMTTNMTTMLCACTLDLAKMTTSSSACVDSLEEFLPLEGAVRVAWKLFGLPARNSKMLEPDERKMKRVHYKICLPPCLQHYKSVAAPPGSTHQ